MRSCLQNCLLIVALSCLAGCNSDNKEQPFTESGAAGQYADYVPPTAQVVAEGTGLLMFTPKTHGTLYLLDLSDMRKVKEMMTPHVVVTGGPQPGSEITFDPESATFSRAGKKPQKLTHITPGHKYQLRWEPYEPG